MAAWSWLAPWDRWRRETTSPFRCVREDRTFACAGLRQYFHCAGERTCLFGRRDSDGDESLGGSDQFVIKAVSALGSIAGNARSDQVRLAHGGLPGLPGGADEMKTAASAGGASRAMTELSKLRATEDEHTTTSEEMHQILFNAITEHSLLPGTKLRRRNWRMPSASAGPASANYCSGSTIWASSTCRPAHRHGRQADKKECARSVPCAQDHRNRHRLRSGDTGDQGRHQAATSHLGKGADRHRY